MKKLICNLIGNICMLWWTFWSNIRFKDAVRENKGVKDEHKVTDLKSVHVLLRVLYTRFTWTKDGVDQLYDAITPPPQC